MKIEIDSLKCAKMLTTKNFNQIQAEGLVEGFTQTEIRNIYDKLETNIMINSIIKDTLLEERKRFEEMMRGFRNMRTEDNARYAEERKREENSLREMRQEMRSYTRWTVATIITIGLALAGYMSALLHATH